MLSLNSENDLKIINLLNAAQSAGAEITLTTTEKSGSNESIRQATIVWQTHATHAKAL